MKITIPANGNTILETARETGIPIEAACGGRGKCGKCKIKLLQGQCSQSGFLLGPQTVAPSSISAWVKSPASFG